MTGSVPNPYKPRIKLIDLKDGYFRLYIEGRNHWNNRCSLYELDISLWHLDAFVDEFLAQYTKVKNESIPVSASKDADKRSP